MNKDYDGAKEHFQSILKLLNASDVFYPGINDERGASIHGASCFRELAKRSLQQHNQIWTGNAITPISAKISDSTRH